MTIAGNIVTDPAGRGGGIDIAAAPNSLAVHQGTIKDNAAALGAQVNISSGEFGVNNTLVAGGIPVGQPRPRSALEGTLRAAAYQ